MLYFFLIVSVLLNFALCFFLVRSVKKLLQMDTLFDVIADDLEVGIRFFNDVLAKPTFSNSQELSIISRNINVLRDRMMINAANIRMLKAKEERPQNHQAPVVVG